jgi:hypothetical protein
MFNQNNNPDEILNSIRSLLNSLHTMNENVELQDESEPDHELENNSYYERSVNNDNIYTAPHNSPMFNIFQPSIFPSSTSSIPFQLNYVSNNVSDDILPPIIPMFMTNIYNQLTVNHEDLSAYSDIACDHWENLTKIKLKKENPRSVIIISTIIDLWKKSKNGEFPNLQEVGEELYTISPAYIKFHISGMGKRFILHFISTIGMFPTITDIELCHEYYVMEKKMPTLEELAELFQKRVRFAQNPVEFHAEDKQYVPVSNLKQLIESAKPYEGEGDVCNMCMDSIEKGQNIFILNCKHIFHSESKNCLGKIEKDDDNKILSDDEGTVRKWFSKMHSCPLCRQDVNGNNLNINIESENTKQKKD